MFWSKDKRKEEKWQRIMKRKEKTDGYNVLNWAKEISQIHSLHIEKGHELKRVKFLEIDIFRIPHNFTAILANI